MRALAAPAVAAARSSRGPAAPAGKRAPAKKRVHGGPEFAFEGSSANSVEFLVRTGVRPAEKAAARLVEAQDWLATQQTEEWAAAPPGVPLGFTQVRECLKLLINAGVDKKSLPRSLVAFPGVLALPPNELDARLDALNELGLERSPVTPTYLPGRLGRALERAPALLALPPPAVAEVAAALTALGVNDVAVLAVAEPAVLCEAPGAIAARASELTALTGVEPPALGALVSRHPQLLAPMVGGTLADRAAFWAEAGVAGPALASLVASAPAALCASVLRSLKPKAAFAAEELGLDAAAAAARCPALFGTVNLERTVRPRAAFLRHLGVSPGAIADALAEWATGSADVFVAVAARLAPAASEASVAAFREHAGLAAPRGEDEADGEADA